MKVFAIGYVLLVLLGACGAIFLMFEAKKIAKFNRELDDLDAEMEAQFFNLEVKK